MLRRCDTLCRSRFFFLPPFFDHMAELIRQVGGAYKGYKYTIAKPEGRPAQCVALVEPFRIPGSPLHHLTLFLDNLGLMSSNEYVCFTHWLYKPLVKNNRDKQFYFNRLPYLWKSLPPINLSLSFTTIKRKLTDIFWNSFLANFNTDNNCTYYYKCPCPSCFTHPKSCFTSL